VYSVTMRRVPATIVVVAHILSVYVLNLCIQHAMHMGHIVICGLSGSTILFPHYFIKGKIFGKTLLKIKCVFSFSLQLLSEIFLIPKRTEQNMIKNVYWFSCKVQYRYSCPFLMKLEVSGQIFEKYSNT